MAGPQTPDHLFLYGSLRRGLDQHRALRLDRVLHFVRTETVLGSLYDLGDYPGLVLDPAGRPVHGDAFRIAEASVLPALDVYEGYNPNDTGPFHEPSGRGSLYLRRVITLSGGETAWVYELNGVPRGARTILHGDWLRHIRG